MTSQRYKPPLPLGNFVQCLWYWEGIPEGTHAHERLIQAQPRAYADHKQVHRIRNAAANPLLALFHLTRQPHVRRHIADNRKARHPEECV